MTHRRYRVLYASTDGDILGELPATTVSYTHEINGAGAFAATLPLRPEPDGVQTITTETLAPGRTLLYVERDGVLRWGGVYWSRTGDVDGNVLAINGANFHSYFARRHIMSNLVYTAQDQVSVILKGLIDYAQGSFFGIPALIDTSTLAASGVTRDRTYFGYEAKNVAVAIEQLATVRNGFDFRYQTAYDAGAIKNTIVIVPTLGRPTDHVFELGGNIALLSFEEDASPIVTRSIAFGAGTNAQKLSSVRLAPDLIDQGYLWADYVETHSDIKVQATLDGHAERRLDRGATPVQRLLLRTYVDAIPRYGSYEVGDIVRVIGSYGLFDVDGDFKIMRLTLDVDSANRESVYLECTNAGVFA